MIDTSYTSYDRAFLAAISRGAFVEDAEAAGLAAQRDDMKRTLTKLDRAWSALADIDDQIEAVRSGAGTCNDPKPHSRSGAFAEAVYLLLSLAVLTALLVGPR